MKQVLFIVCCILGMTVYAQEEVTEQPQTYEVVDTVLTKTSDYKDIESGVNSIYRRLKYRRAQDVNVTDVELLQLEQVFELVDGIVPIYGIAKYDTTYVRKQMALSDTIRLQTELTELNTKISHWEGLQELNEDEKKPKLTSFNSEKARLESELFQLKAYKPEEPVE